MNIEEARKVLWLKKNPRPVGELFDEGSLTRSDLEWAAEWAFSPKLKQAAKLLLETLKNTSHETEDKSIPIQETSISVSIPLDQARATPWTFAPFKGQPMGVLLESGQINLKDLGYAIEKAWDERVKQAAIALSLIRLGQAVKEPVISTGPVQVISGGRSFSQRRESLLLFLEGALFGAFAILVIYFGFKSVFRAPNPDAQTLTEVITKPGGIVAISLVLVSVFGFAWLVNFTFDKLTKRLEKQIEYYRIGQEGEDKAVQLIIQALDGNWHLFRNVGLPGRNKGDLDLVLVAPPGVWALEVKNYHGQYRNIGDKWQYKHGKDWKSAFSNPSKQAESNAYRLKNFLKADGINVFVNSAIIWANEESPLSVENPLVAIWSYNRLLDELGNIWHGEKLSKAEQEKIVEKLTKLCENQRSNK